MFDDHPPRHSAAACNRLLGTFLLEPAALLAELAPEGWFRSPLRDADAASVDPEDVEREIVDLVGCALWDVFSDNHTVRDTDGVEYHLGSFRASGGFIADAINGRYPQFGRAYGYLDFYMGGMFRSNRDALEPVYRWIFQGLRRAGCDWEYCFPRIHLISFDWPEEPASFEDFDPSEALRAELAAEERHRQMDETAERMREAHDQDVLRARAGPPPAVVAAYAKVYGRFPAGWPPETSAESRKW